MEGAFVFASAITQCEASLESLWWEKFMKLMKIPLNQLTLPDSHSIRRAVLNWNALFQPWLRLSLCNSKPHNFFSWNQKGLRNSNISEVTSGLWGMCTLYGKPCHPAPLTARSGTRPEHEMTSWRSMNFCLERCIGLMLVSMKGHTSVPRGWEGLLDSLSTACISISSWWYLYMLHLWLDSSHGETRHC